MIRMTESVLPQSPFAYSGGHLQCESVDIADIARRTGTPVYVYSADSIRRQFRAYDRAFGSHPHQVCYAVKANSSLAVLNLLAKEGSGFDIVSGGELYRVLQAGGDPSTVVFSGVGKTAAEVEYALSQGIHSFNCESESELALIDALAGRLGAVASISLRVNPDVNAQTHPYISTGLREHKFGIDIERASSIYRLASQFNNLRATGVSCHIGSQLLDSTPLVEAVGKVLSLIEELRRAGFSIDHVDFGGGLGVAYRPSDEPPDVDRYIRTLVEMCKSHNLKVMVEPGRSIVGQAGALIMRVLYRKATESKEFIVVDAAMNDLIRPSLYQSHHEIVPVRQSELGTITADVVGPVCESGDFLARGREIANVAPGDLLAICTAGAYGFVLASNYNSRTRSAEVLVEGDSWRVVRNRESLEDLVRGETI